MFSVVKLFIFPSESTILNQVDSVSSSRRTLNVYSLLPWFGVLFHSTSTICIKPVSRKEFVDTIFSRMGIVTGTHYGFRGLEAKTH